MWTVLNQKKNHISDFDVSSYGQFCNFHDSSKNKNRKIVISFDSAYTGSIMKMEAKLEVEGKGGGVVCISPFIY